MSWPVRSTWPTGMPCFLNACSYSHISADCPTAAAACFSGIDCGRPLRPRRATPVAMAPGGHERDFAMVLDEGGQVAGEAGDRLARRALSRRGDEPAADLHHDAAGVAQRAAGIHGSLARRRAISWTSAGRPSPVTAEMAWNGQAVGRAEVLDGRARRLGARQLHLVHGHDLRARGELLRVGAQLVLDRLVVGQRIAPGGRDRDR